MDTPYPAPQVIGHRGFKGKHPENSMSAFKGAVEVESNAIELDLALSKDDVVVISHVCLGIRISDMEKTGLTAVYGRINH